jgi:hypothetical protein
MLRLASINCHVPGSWLSIMQRFSDLHLQMTIMPECKITTKNTHIADTPGRIRLQLQLHIRYLDLVDVPHARGMLSVTWLVVPSHPAARTSRLRDTAYIRRHNPQGVGPREEDHTVSIGAALAWGGPGTWVVGRLL